MKAKSKVGTLTMAAVLLAGPITLAACGGSGSGPASSSAPGTVLIKNFAFSPTHLTVAPGATVTVKNLDSSTHTLTANDGSFDTGSIEPGHSATFRAPQAGTHPFHCAFHQFMTGTLTVSG